MLLPLQITFRGIDHSAPIEENIREKAAKLEQFAEHITSCRVVVEPAGKHHQHGNQYAVHVDVTLPEGEVAATHEPGNHKEYRDVTIAIRDAFDSAARQLEDCLRRQRGDVKAHMDLPHALVSKLPLTADYGFLATPDGREIYFHRNSVLNDEFDELQIGSEVAFVEELGEKGPQASTVRQIGRHGGSILPDAIAGEIERTRATTP